MTWPVLIGLIVLLSLALFASMSRRKELASMQRTVKERERAVRQGADQAQLQHPVIDLTRCLGCGTCVDVCPEDGVLELVHGQAMVVNGARCQGISACEVHCPVDAITVTIANLKERKDIPAIKDSLEAVGTPGLFLAGEVTAHALIKTAIEHGAAVGAEVGTRVQQQIEDGIGYDEDVFDLVIVGAGPAGLGCALEAKRHGVSFVVLEQESGPGGTVAKYPRRKLVMTQPVAMPLYGKLKRTTYTKEELVDLWHMISNEQELPIEGGQVFVGIERDEDGNFMVQTETDTWLARNVCLAIGRRGVPRKLEVPGEELPKVTYSLIDANSYQDRRILVVGGGDTAVEAAIGLAEQPGNEVTISYRKESFFRIRSKNEQRLADCMAEGRVKVLYQSEVRAIRPGSVELVVRNGTGPVPASPRGRSGGPGGPGGSGGVGGRASGPGAGGPEGALDENWLGELAAESSPASTLAGRERIIELPNDEVFVMAGGVPPFQLLEQSGVSFDASHRQAGDPLVEQGTGLTKALTAALVMTFLALFWAVWHADYYLKSDFERAAHVKHTMLRPGSGIGLWLGVAALVLIVVNLLYLLRRSTTIRFNLGSLRLWMTSHVATGILALLCAMLHGAMSPQQTPGGHAFWALVVLLVTGAIGRYFYAYVPRAANGRELQLAEVRTQMSRMSEEWDQGQVKFRERARAEVNSLAEAKQWEGSFFGRVLGLFGYQRDFRRVLNQLEEEGREQGIAEDQIQETMRLARRAHRTALMIAHYEDLRAVLNTWRYLHKWFAWLMVLLVVVHIVHAWAYGAFFFGSGE